MAKLLKSELSGDKSVPINTTLANLGSAQSAGVGAERLITDHGGTSVPAVVFADENNNWIEKIGVERTSTESPILRAPAYIAGPPPAWEENASYFGLKADPLKDNTSAFQKAFDDSGSAGCELNLGYGTYNVDGQINITGGYPVLNAGSTIPFLSGLAIKGRGWQTQIVQQLTKSGLFKVSAAPPSNTTSQFNMRNLALIGCDTNNYSAFAIQFNGDKVTENIGSYSLEDVLFKGFYTDIRAEDITFGDHYRVFFLENRYGVEANYNCDVFRFSQSTWGSPSTPQQVTGVATLSSNVVTGISPTSTALMIVGMVISSSKFPLNTRITAITSTTITVDQVATATGSTVFDCSFGIGVAFGNGPWVPAVNSTNSSRGGDDAWIFQSCSWMRNEKSLDLSNVGTRGVKIDTCYVERGSTFIDVGNAGDGTTSAGPLTIEDTKFSQVSARDGCIRAISASGGGSHINMYRNYGDTATTEWGAVPYIKLANGLTNHKIYWSGNKLNTASPTTVKQIGGAKSFDLGSSQSTWRDFTLGHAGVQPNYRESGSGTTATPSCSEGNTDGLIQTITGAFTVNAPSTTNLWEGFEYAFTFIQNATGGYAITWNAAWKLATLTAAGTANQKAIVKFRYDGTNFVQIANSGWY